MSFLRSFKSNIFVFLLVLVSVLAANTKDIQNVWQDTSFSDFVEGTLTDGGANTYVAADGTIRLINVWDLNSDGYLDIVFPSSHDQNEKPDSFIYLGEFNFDPMKRIELPSDGGRAVEIADLNRDQYLDLILVNRFNGTRTDLDSYIYWGSQLGFDPSKRARLPTRGGEAVAVADLNMDGWPDIVFANSGLSYHVAVDHFNQSFIYWGSSAGYSQNNRTTLKTVLGRDVKIFDLDQDGLLDLVFAEEGNQNDEAGICIYWGDGKGNFNNRPPSRLPGERTVAVAVEDLNGDNWPEIILANSARLKAREMGIYNIVDTIAIDSFIYWGSKKGYSRAERTSLPTVGAKAVDVADLNDDKRPDIVFANGGGGATFIYWGSSAGFKPYRRTALPSAGASDVKIEDINQDGYFDLVIAQKDKGHSKKDESLIYWGNPKGLDKDQVTAIPTLGATGIAIGDLDANGKKDLVFANKRDGSSHPPSLIYWGNQKGRYKKKHRLSLPTSGPGMYAAADINQDNFPDLFFPMINPIIYWGSTAGFSQKQTTRLNTQQMYSGRFADFNRDGYLDLASNEWKPGHQETSLYWGGPTNYSKDNRFVFHVSGLRHHTVADLDQNGWLDIIFTSTTNQELFIYWNQEEGFNNNKKTRLPTAVSVSAEIADLNADGYLDIIAPNLFDLNPAPGQPQSFGGSPQGNTFIYWGSSKGYSTSKRQTLPSIGNADVAVADLNQDNRLDLVLTSYHAGYTRSHPSTIYWNSAQGFDASKSTQLPTNSASGVLVTDFDQNGYKDILFSCHSKNGNHRNNAFLYWGSNKGYSPNHRSLLPVLGPHFLSVIDIGHIYDRGDRYDFISAPFDGGINPTFSKLSWKGDTPFRTALEFQIRTAPTRQQLDNRPWQGPNGPKSFYQKSPAVLDSFPKRFRWIQYKASLISPASANSPVLRSVSISFN